MSNNHIAEQYDNDDAQNSQKDHQHDQTMDQAIDKTPIGNATPESLGVTWTEGRYSGKKMRSWMFFVCLVTVLFVVFGVYFKVSANLWILVLLIPVLAWIHFLAAYIYRTWTIKYRLTSHRLYNESGLLKKTIDTLEIIDIEDMQMEQSLLDRLVNGGVGTVVIHSNDKTHSVIRLEAMENPQQAFESIDEIRRRLRSTGARIIRSVNS